MTVADSTDDRKRITSVVRANRSRNTGPELALRRALVASGIRRYRIHWAKAPGGRTWHRRGVGSPCS
jgi:G:T-mismatch repair DNA endonuclease (very short patch repair protein)